MDKDPLYSLEDDVRSPCGLGTGGRKPPGRHYVCLCPPTFVVDAHGVQHANPRRTHTLTSTLDVPYPYFELRVFRAQPPPNP